MKNILKHKHFLLGVKNPKTRKNYIKKADKASLNSINEVALNVLKGNVPITRAQKKRLAKYKRNLRFLANKRASIKKKRALLLQWGGAFLPMLLGPVLSLAASVASKYI